MSAEDRPDVSALISHGGSCAHDDELVDDHGRCIVCREESKVARARSRREARKLEPVGRGPFAGWRTMTSIKPGDCIASCGSIIRMGDPIRWKRGAGAVHEACAVRAEGAS
jgi:hypothetical protein